MAGSSSWPFANARAACASTLPHRMGRWHADAGPVGESVGDGAILGRPLEEGGTLVARGGDGRSVSDRHLGRCVPLRGERWRDMADGDL